MKFTMKKIISKLHAYIVGPEDDKHVIPLPSESGRGRGFTYKGNEFVHHTDLHHFETAFYNLLRGQKFALGMILGFFALALAVNWHLTLIIFFSVITIMYFADMLFNAYVISRTLYKRPEVRISKEEIAVAEAVEWPSYTIFCPLYKEWQVVPQFAEAMQALDYPKDKLQIVFLLEENDPETIEKVRTAGLPPHFEVVVVPHSKPKTKPKAMNYGLMHARGDYLVVYDAEDKPEPDQLKKAILTFRKSDPNVVCVQAKLNYYNPRQNILTRLFTAEYSLWFDLVLPGLQSIFAPIPLGGTSNHFRTDTLRALYGWDAFNVTEDCDLGMRLAYRGYRTAIVESTTYEEANSEMINWYNQRSRWIKGYIITYFVHMRTPFAHIRSGKTRDIALFQFIVGGKVISLFVNPIMWVTTICYFAFRTQTGPFIETLFPGVILHIGVFSLIFGNLMYLYFYMIGCSHRNYNDLVKYVFLIPLYWLGMSIAAWKAVYEVVVKPHYWAKTKHGLHLKGSVNTTQTPINPTEAVRASEEDSEQKTLWQQIAAGSGLLVISTVVVNFLNFGFNAYLGRELSLEDYGIVTMVSTFTYILALFSGALSTTITHSVSYLEGVEEGRGSHFFKKLRISVWAVGAAISLVWLMATPIIADFFHVSELIIILSFAPAIMFKVIDSCNKGYLGGVFGFRDLAFIILAEAVAKFIIVVYLVGTDQREFAALSIPGSMIFVSLCSTFAAYLMYRKAPNTATFTNERKPFPYTFYMASLMSGISTAAFLSIDVILAKHYLTPADAGRYAMLALVGKMIFFFGSLFSMFIVTLVSRSEGQHRDSAKTFSYILAGTTVLTAGAGGGLALLGWFFVPLLLGLGAISIVPFVPIYAFAMSLFTLSATIVTYHLARKHYFFSIASCFMAAAMWVGIVIYDHSSVRSFVNVITFTNVVYFLVIVLAHFTYPSLVYIYRNARDLFMVFGTLPQEAEPQEGKKKILIFNWRDTQSVFAGGAETYIMNLASRWVGNGHSVTLFTSNDGHQKPHDVIEGVLVIRRGGFFVVYIAAFLYYVLRFRGRYDVIIDCENGIPFFTPLYVREPVYCLVHHIHQEVFRAALSRPAAAFACFLEKDFMPLVYRHSKFVTVSESSRRDMEKLSITDKKIEVIHPGVDLAYLKPGEKSLTPLISYVGRLKDYKSVDVLIRAFAKIKDEIPDAHVVVAGGGDEYHPLKLLTKKLNLESRVTFEGKVSEERKREILQRSWVFVMPSMMEGWGITAIEASACGTLVLASDVPGLRDSIQNGKTGELIPYGDVESFAQKIKKYISDAKLRTSYEEQAIEWASRFAWEKSSERFISLIESDPAVLNLRTVTTRIRI